MTYGKIVADQIQHSSEGTVNTQYVVNGSAKARCLYNQVSPAVRSSVNISTVTDLSTGGMAFNLTNATSSVDNATPLYQAQPVNNNSGSDNFPNPTVSFASSFRCYHFENGTNYDCAFNMFTLHGDLA